MYSQPEGKSGPPQDQERWYGEGWQVAKEKGLGIYFRDFHHFEGMGEERVFRGEPQAECIAPKGLEWCLQNKT